MLHPVFMLIAWLQVTSAHVEPPTNVTLRCHNFHNILEWSYSQLQPDLRFKVYLRSTHSDPVEQWVEPPTLQADLSHLPDPSYDYSVNVTAVIGENISDPSPEDPLDFSYYWSSSASQICVADFPTVIITEEDGHILFQFEHPWLLYKNKLPSHLINSGYRRRRRNDEMEDPSLPEFSYNVISQVSSETFVCDESECWDKIPVDRKEEKHCLKFNGEMFKIEFKGTQDYCTQANKPSNFLMVIIPVVSILAIISLCIVMFMVYKKMTTPPPPPSSSFPPSMTFASRLKQFTYGVAQESISVLSVQSPPPPQQQEEDRLISSHTSPTTLDRFPIGLTETDERVSDFVDEENAEEPKYMPGSILDTGETPADSGSPNGYEKREKVIVELAPGEVAEAYRG